MTLNLFNFSVVELEGNPKQNREEWDSRLFITLVPKVFLFVGLTTLGTLVNFDWLVH